MIPWTQGLKETISEGGLFGHGGVFAGMERVGRCSGFRIDRAFGKTTVSGDLGYGLLFLFSLFRDTKTLLGDVDLERFTRDRCGRAGPSRGDVIWNHGQLSGWVVDECWIDSPGAS